jgi:hypothetical protein
MFNPVVWDNKLDGKKINSISKHQFGIPRVGWFFAFLPCLEFSPWHRSIGILGSNTWSIVELRKCTIFLAIFSGDIP